MATFMQRFRGSEMSEITTDMGAVLGYVQRLESAISVLQSKIEDVLEVSAETSAVVAELRGSNHIGKKPIVLREAIEESSKMSVKEIRQAIHGAARRQPSGYNAIYLKVREITGVDIFAVGKVRVTPADGLGFTDNNETYINAIFKKGVQEQAGAIALDIIRNK